MEKKRIRTQSAILAAAHQLFSEFGYEETSMESIAEHAEIAAGTLYNYYSSKSILLMAIFADMTDKLQEKAPQPSVGVINAEIAVGDLTAVLQFVSLSTVLFPKAIMRQVMAQLFVLNPEDIAELVSLDMQIIGMLIPILDNMRQANLLRADVDIQAAAMLLFGSAMIQHQAYISIVEMTEKQLNDAIAAQVKMMLWGLLVPEMA